MRFDIDLRTIYNDDNRRRNTRETYVINSNRVRNERKKTNGYHLKKRILNQ